MRTKSGSQEEIEKALTDLAEGWDHLGHPEKAAEAERALGDVLNGEHYVVAGHTEYLVQRVARTPAND